MFYSFVGGLLKKKHSKYLSIISVCLLWQAADRLCTSGGASQISKARNQIRADLTNECTTNCECMARRSIGKIGDLWDTGNYGTAEIIFIL